AKHAAQKQAFVLSSVDESAAPFDVLDSGGHSVFSGTLEPNAGSWNAAYPFVFPLDFTSLMAAGTYTIQVDGPAPATSPAFMIPPSNTLYRPLLVNTKFFYEAQRDGTDVDHSVLKRRPSHLNDAHATTYLPPVYKHYSLAKDLVPTGGPPFDALGGWFDAG